MNRASEIFKVRISPSGRSFSEHFGIIEPAIIETWQKVVSVFSTCTYFEKVNINCDWSEVLHALGEQTKREERYTEAQKTPEDLDRYFSEEKEKTATPIIDPIVKIEISNNEELSNGHHLNLFLYNFFLVMNLSAPASCGHIEILNDDGGAFAGINGLNLDPSFLESAWMRSLDSGWPRIKMIPLEKTWDWFTNLKLGVKQVSNTRIERTLYCLLNFCTETQLRIRPSLIIWLTNALESIYVSPPGVVSTTLRKRIFTLLGKPENHKSISKSIRQFYDLRSDFVHGRMEIIHPNNNDLFDKTIDDKTYDLMQNLDYGLAIILATVQEMVMRNWQGLEFSEMVHGIRFEEGTEAKMFYFPSPNMNYDRER